MSYPSDRYRHHQKQAAERASAGSSKGEPLHLVLQERLVIHAKQPVTILEGTLTLYQAAYLNIHGLISGTSVNVFGVAVYLNGQPLYRPTRQNLCHPDCCYTHFGNGRANFQLVQPVHLLTEEQAPGSHHIRLAGVSVWQDKRYKTWINDRKDGGMAGTTTLTVTPL